jgi:hypothetical protein
MDGCFPGEATWTWPGRIANPWHLVSIMWIWIQLTRCTDSKPKHDKEYAQVGCTLSNLAKQTENMYKWDHQIIVRRAAQQRVKLTHQCITRKRRSTGGHNLIFIWAAAMPLASSSIQTTLILQNIVAKKNQTSSGSPFRLRKHRYVFSNCTPLQVLNAFIMVMHY